MVREKLITGLIVLPFLLCLAQAQTTYTVSTIAGNGTLGYAGDGGSPTSAELSIPYHIVYTNGKLYIADQANHRIRVISGGTISTVAGNGTAGYSGDAASATSAELDAPTGMALDSSGNLYIADTTNQAVRKVNSSGTISTIAGDNSLGAGYSGDGAGATAAQLYSPTDVVVDSSGKIYIADEGNSRIRVVTTDGNIATFAGNGSASYYGDGGQALNAEINLPRGLAIDSSGDIFIADTGNNRIREVTTDGIIRTVAGNGGQGFSGDGGKAISAELFGPTGVAVDSQGDIFIADRFNGRIREVTPDGIIRTIAGNGSIGYSGDGGPATDAAFDFPTGVAVDSSGNVYVADNENNVIRELTPMAVTPSITGVISASAFGALTAIAPGSWIEIYGTNLAGGTRGWTSDDFNGLTAPTDLSGTSATIGGVPAFVSYISSGQVNVQVPSGVTAGSQQVIVTNGGVPSQPFPITVSALAPGVLAPASFNVGGKQYVAALFSDGTTYVAPTGAIASVTSRPAHPGETITIYGVGFGPVTPDMPAGQIAQGQTQLTNPMTVTFGSMPAILSYWGLAPGSVGLYQFNVVVPNVPTSDAVPVTFTLNNGAGTQTLYTAVQD
jgi:uncharacterized protein (TIGR03437 family)